MPRPSGTIGKDGNAKIGSDIINVDRRSKLNNDTSNSKNINCISR